MKRYLQLLCVTLVVAVVCGASALAFEATATPVPSIVIVQPAEHAEETEETQAPAIVIVEPAGESSDTSAQFEGLEGASYNVVNSSDVPPMPQTLVNATGGLPDSFDILRGKYDLDAIEQPYNEWNEVAPALLDDLLKKAAS